jgi:transcription elongation GreA/GreB family factor
MVITPQSPLGHQILGKKEGDRFQFPTAGKGNGCRVVQVS